MQRLISIPATLLLFFLVVKIAHAQVLINEVFPAPSTGNEWVELYNAGSSPVTLTNWQLRDQLTTPSTFYTFAATSLAPQSFITIDLSSAKLNNAADGVTMLNETGQVVDEMSYTSSQTDLSWARQPNGTGQFILTTPTKNTANPTPTPSPSPSPSPTPTPSPSPTPSPTANADTSWWPLISLQAVMACPVSGQPESVTLFNNDSQSHDLTNWHIMDASEQTRKIIGSIDPHSTLLISWQSSLLNNSGDQVTLLSLDGTEIESMNYSQCTTGQPLTKHDGQWSAATDTTATKLSPTPTASPRPSPSPNQTPSFLPSHSLPISISYAYTPFDIQLTASSSSTSALSPTTFIKPPILGATPPSTSPANTFLPLASGILGGTLLAIAGGWGIYETTTYSAHSLAPSNPVGDADFLPLLTE